MSAFTPILRLAEYYRRHGIVDTWRRLVLGAKRALFAGDMAVFYCDLGSRSPRAVNMPRQFSVRRVDTLAELGTERLQEFISIWNPKVAEKNTRERFDQGASLWLVEHEDKIAGYGWSLRGKAIAPYYFPLGADDVQLFDFYVLSKYRGRGVYWLLIGYILSELSAGGASRAYADTGEWNKPQLAAFKITPFRLLGVVRTYRFFGRLFMCWRSDNSVSEPLERAIRRIKKGYSIQ